MAGSSHQRIVLGIDGSPGSIAAARWAVAEHKMRGGTLDAVGVWNYLTIAIPGGVVPLRPGAPQAAETLETVLSVLRVAGASPEDEGVEADVEQGEAGRVLVNRAASADLVVVGPPHRTGTAVRYLLHHSPCPVVVVHPPAERH